MPDYSPDYTPRYVVEYLSAGVHHHVTVRGYRGEAEFTVVNRGSSALSGMLTPLVTLLPTDFAWISAEYIPEDTNVGVPTSLPGVVVGTSVLANFSNQDKATSVGWVGRSVSTPMRLFIFGWQFSPDSTTPNQGSDFRIHSVEDAAFASSISALNSAGLAANNNLAGAWALYVNLKVNDYWLRQVRKLGGI